MRIKGEQLRAIGIMINFFLPFLFVFVFLPLEMYVGILLGIIYIIVSAYVISKTGQTRRKENRNLTSRIRYRVHHSLFEVKSFSTRYQSYYRGKHDLSSILQLQRRKSYKRYELVASIKEVPFTYYEETLVPKISIYKYPSFKGFVVAFKSDVSKETRVLEKVEEFSKYYEGYVVLNVGQIKFYVNSEQYIHEIYENKDIKEQISKIYNDVLKLSKILESIEKILQEDYKY